ncbi:hypothetical protein QA640_09675 [Bradyrhizobium sp. CB82]|uniref:tetratricopeptide repeat protein n=1 Tax=Bradyrhizobium sp. CB82 TaxID=3039159 RepID=UPI0024B06EA2|nr:hypothetical protein [Bradyrhizobium sp. CB82]WFU42700.1 hypothetical protein QA640_09675 [Bradyrhizobium sp. CB82]
MLRVFFLTLLILLSSAPAALADPKPGDDLETCRERKLDLPTRLVACEDLLASDRVAGKDKSIALTVRGFSLLNKRDFDHALEAFAAACDADPDNMVALDGQAQAHQRKGQDDLAMADYNLALQKRPNYGGAYNDRGTLYLRKGALQSALDDFNLAIKYTPNLLVGHTNRARTRTFMKNYDGALADFADASADRSWWVTPSANLTAS